MKLKQPQRLKQQPRRFRDGSIRRCSSSRSPVAGEEIENGAEVPQNEGPDETGNELQPGDEITDPDQ
jgi:hypothetical protein